MRNKLLIVGIDPGTTLGYAVLDVNGCAVKVKSSKQMNLNSLISEVVELGKVIVVGADKAKVPNLVEMFSIKTGGKRILPEEDLKVNEKKRLISGYKVKDSHQADALASALFAYKEMGSLLKKIDVFVKAHKKMGIKDRIIELVVTKNISIKLAVDIIERPEKEDAKIIKKVVEEKELRQADFLKLYDRAKRYEKESLFLRKQNNILKGELKNSFDKYEDIVKKVKMFKSDEKAEELINFKERRIKFFDGMVKVKDAEIGLLREKINNLNFILSSLNDNYLLKKLNNLGSLEFEDKTKFLNVGEGDILLVNNPNIFNNKVVEKIKGEVRIIVYKKCLNKSTKRLGFVFIDYKNLILREMEHFAVVGKDVLNKEANQVNILNNIVENYKKERIIDLDN